MIQCCHLVDVACTLLFNMKVHKHFWGDILTVCQLINCMPSAVLNHRSLFSLLYPDHAPFPLTRVFGCVTLVHVLDSHKDKLSPWACKCVFLGTLVLRRAIAVTFLSLIDTL